MSASLLAPRAFPPLYAIHAGPGNGGAIRRHSAGRDAHARPARWRRPPASGWRATRNATRRSFLAPPPERPRSARRSLAVSLASSSSSVSLGAGAILPDVDEEV